MFIIKTAGAFKVKIISNSAFAHLTKLSHLFYIHLYETLKFYKLYSSSKKPQMFPLTFTQHSDWLLSHSFMQHSQTSYFTAHVSTKCFRDQYFFYVKLSQKLSCFLWGKKLAHSTHHLTHISTKILSQSILFHVKLSHNLTFLQLIFFGFFCTLNFHRNSHVLYGKNLGPSTQPLAFTQNTYTVQPSDLLSHKSLGNSSKLLCI